MTSVVTTFDFFFFFEKQKPFNNNKMANNSYKIKTKLNPTLIIALSNQCKLKEEK